MDEIKHIIDVSAIGTSFAALLGMLPHISSLLAVIWLGLRIYESKTVQAWLNPQTIPPSCAASKPKPEREWDENL